MGIVSAVGSGDLVAREALVVPIETLPKFNLEVDRLTAGAPLTPEPVRLVVCGLPAALSLTERMAVRVPVAVGVNVTLIEQLPPAPKVEVQVWFSEKSPTLAPVIEILVMVTAVLPRFDNVAA